MDMVSSNSHVEDILLHWCTLLLWSMTFQLVVKVKVKVNQNKASKIITCLTRFLFSLLLFAIQFSSPNWWWHADKIPCQFWWWVGLVSKYCCLEFLLVPVRHKIAQWFLHPSKTWFLWISCIEVGYQGTNGFPQYLSWAEVVLQWLERIWFNGFLAFPGIQCQWILFHCHEYFVRVGSSNKASWDWKDELCVWLTYFQNGWIPLLHSDYLSLLWRWWDIYGVFSIQGFLLCKKII